MHRGGGTVLAMTTDTATVVETYLAAWNATDPAERRMLVERTFTPDARYLDPLMRGEGHDGLDAMIAAAQAQYPGCRFVLAAGPDAHNDVARFSWHLAPEDGERLATGHDFAVVAADGRLSSVTGFLDH